MWQVCGGYSICLLLLDSVFLPWEPYFSRITTECTHSPGKGRAVILLTPPKPVRTINLVVHLGMHGCHSNNTLIAPSSPLSNEHLLRVLRTWTLLSQTEPLTCSPHELHIYQESLEREETLCWSKSKERSKWKWRPLFSMGCCRRPQNRWLGSQMIMNSFGQLKCE